MFLRKQAVAAVPCLVPIDACHDHSQLHAAAETGFGHLQCSDKPAEADKYGFSNFARMLMSGKGLNPLPSDSRRRPDRSALQVGAPLPDLTSDAMSLKLQQKAGISHSFASIVCLL